jgi:hypothetical protein
MRAVLADGREILSDTVVADLSLAAQIIGTAGFSTAGIRAGATRISDDLDFKLELDQNDNPYVAFKDSSQEGRLTVMRFDGKDWTLVGIPGFTPKAVSWFNLAIDGSNRPVIWFGPTKTWDALTNDSLFIMAFNGTTWQSLPSPGAGILSVASHYSDTIYAALKIGSPATPSHFSRVMRLAKGSWEYLPEVDACSIEGIDFGSKGQLYGICTPDHQVYDIVRFTGSIWEALPSLTKIIGTGCKNLSVSLSGSDAPVVLYMDNKGGNWHKVQFLNGSWKDMPMIEQSSITSLSTDGRAMEVRRNTCNRDLTCVVLSLFKETTWTDILNLSPVYQGTGTAYLRQSNLGNAYLATPDSRNGNRLFVYRIAPK